MTRPPEPPKCPATVLISDDYWGGFTDHCELPLGHTGDHRASRNACEPRAYLGWAAQ